MTGATATRIAAALGFLAVALGAAGAHGRVHDVLAQNTTLQIWETAVFYHFVHTVMLFVLATRPSFRQGPWWCFLIGIMIFSGSLYVMALINLKWLGPITPIGGVILLVGWAWLAICPGRENPR